MKNAISQFLIISGLIVLPWALIRLTNLDIKIFDFVKQISDIGVVALLAIPPIIYLTVKWLFEPRDNSNQSYSGNNDLLIKFHK